MGVIDTEGIEEGVTGMVEVETGTERTGMVEEDPGGRDLPAPTTGSRDQGGITDPEAGATRDQDTKNNELEIRESEPNKTKPIPYLPLVWVRTTCVNENSYLRKMCIWNNQPVVQQLN